jgi:protein-disulfide isomerase
MPVTRRQLLATIGSIGGVSLSGCIRSGNTGKPDNQITNTQPSNEQTTTTQTSGSQVTPTSDGRTTTTPISDGKTATTSLPNGPVASAPIPRNPSEYTYATMGTETKSEPVITYFGNWKCPACRKFSIGLLKKYVKDYIESGSVSLRFRALAYVPTTQPPFRPFLGSDAPRAARAGLIVWHIEPESYWSYHEYVFAHQPPEAREWATTDNLVEFARKAGVKKTDKLRAQLEAGKYQKEVKQTAVAAVKAGVSATPQLLINGQVVSPFKVKRVRSLLSELGEGNGNTST